jgi:SAM-dependent methyltransferase
LEKIPAAALAGHPFPINCAMDHAHRDCLREVGSLSESRLARYELAAAHACDGDTILDAGCGLGDGTAILARRFPNSRVIGIDPRAASIDYARLHFGSILPNLDFRVADPCVHRLGGLDRCP